MLKLLKLSPFFLLFSFFGLPTPLLGQASDKTPANDPSYILQPNDVIRLDVFEEADLSGSVRILKTGHASFPLIGSVKIGNLSIDAASKIIHDLYAKDYLVAPRITLTVQQYATAYVSVIGSVTNAGQIALPVSGQIDLATAMATAGGLAPTADANRIVLIRNSGSTSTHTYNSIVSGDDGRIQMKAGDRIIVNQSGFVGKRVTILGRVGRQGPIAFPVSGKLDLISAIALAGGLTDLANPKKITINRQGKVYTVNYQELSQRGDQPVYLQPDDIINVPERLF